MQVCRTDVRLGFAAYKQGEVSWKIFANKPDNGLYIAPALQPSVRKKAPSALPAAVSFQFLKQHCNAGDWVLVLDDKGGRTTVSARVLGLHSATVATSIETVLLFQVSRVLFQ